MQYWSVYMPQLRQNIITGEWVVIAPERAKRPSDFVLSSVARQQKKEECPFCVGGEAYKNRYREFETKDIYVIPNKYPAFVESEAHVSPRSYKVENDFYRVRPSMGGHDVVVIKDHELDLHEFDRKTWTSLFEMFKLRYEHYDKDHFANYVLPIYNHGPQAGASIEHPHAQIFTSPIIPNIVEREVHHTQNYFEHNGACAFCDLVAHEKHEKIRVVAENRDFIAFTQFAARFPFETWILPKKHKSCFEHITGDEISALAKICRDTFGKIGHVLNNPPLNFFIHSSPTMFEENVYYHWHLEIGPRLSTYGGYELGGGVVIDVVSPEKAAMYLMGFESD